LSRRELARHEQFDEVSPEVGRLDEEALERALHDDPDAALALLADLTGATDAKLRELARRLAGRLVVDIARRGAPRRQGIGRITRLQYRADAGDLDLDASLEPLAVARWSGSLVSVEDLKVRGWTKPGTALCLLVDRSGSMTGRPLATAAVAAAAVSWRAPVEHAVVAFGADAVVLKSLDVPLATEQVIERLLVLRGHGTTDVALALRTAAQQLGRGRSGRRIAVLLSDCRATVPGDVVTAARQVDELWIVAPAGDTEEAAALARATGARLTAVSGPTDIPTAFDRLLNP